LGGEPLGEAEDDYAELDRRFMEQAVWAPYGSERFTTFASKRIELDQLYHHVLFGHDYASISLQIGPGG
jgi:peptide/nickel transport system substrate-binding protein